MADLKCICGDCEGDVLTIDEMEGRVLFAISEKDGEEEYCTAFVYLNHQQALNIIDKLNLIVKGYKVNAS